ncbi:LamG domain-containing protein [Hahella aquimaris]|uniref:LamG domain-containing protein n=1 Tax=Hahella sp. HNIBRBA332 TaxID=3015983 RepID=UPI00273CE89C|nr:LamG domain-containing protein [Hahella sp. HNIBRBA332]WLQ16970.1 LamG domain-containing protein [Hahella sp. HNIBRBA332]
MSSIQQQIIRAVAISIAAISILLSGCGGNSGASNENLPNTNRPGQGGNYSGPAPATDDVQQFKLSLWDKLSPTNRCGSCHTTGGQSPMFVHKDDINVAYSEANKVVNLSDPSQSRMVSKVLEGHNCWENSVQICGELITKYISDWAGGASGDTKKIDLIAPTDKDPGETKNFPADSSLFSSTVYPLLTTNCAGCHRESAAIPQSPYFAGADVDSAYAAAKSKIDLGTPTNSRFVVRLRDEFHNCWSGSCANDAAKMLEAVETFSGNIDPDQVDPELVASKALSLTDGLAANSGGRYEQNVIALYEFKTGEGVTAYDTSGVDPALNLTLTNDVEWVGGWGIKLNGGKAQGSTSNSKKLHDLIKATGEYTIEAWVAPGNVTQEGPARIISYSAGVNARNFTLGQVLYSYSLMNRTSETDQNGEPALVTDNNDEDLQATLQHVVATYSPANGRRIYVNGRFTDDEDMTTAGNLNDWDDTFAFVLGNEASNNRPWQGTIRMVAVHNRALTQDQISQNFEAGVGQKFYLLFGTSHLIDVPQSYIVFEVSQFDSYSYLFNAPFFISLDPNAEPSSIPVKGMRLGMNGREVTVGQAYKNMNISLNETSYTPDNGQAMSDRGTIIALEKGPEEDEFFLTFEQLGSNSHVYIEADPTPPGPPADGDPVPDIGLRNFDEINATMSAITGVSASSPGVRSTFETVKQQLPTVENINTFLASHQMGVTQLAIQYCDALVESNTLRSAFFPGFDFNASASSAFSGAGRDLVIDPLLNKGMGVNLASQPDGADVRAELNQLIDKLVACGGGCSADRTETVVKASCAAVLGSAAMLVQ